MKPKRKSKRKTGNNSSKSIPRVPLTNNNLISTGTQDIDIDLSNLEVLNIASYTNHPKIKNLTELEKNVLLETLNATDQITEFVETNGKLDDIKENLIENKEKAGGILHGSLGGYAFYNEDIDPSDESNIFYQEDIDLEAYQIVRSQIVEDLNKLVKGDTPKNFNQVIYDPLMSAISNLNSLESIHPTVEPNMGAFKNLISKLVSK